MYTGYNVAKKKNKSALSKLLAPEMLKDFANRRILFISLEEFAARAVIAEAPAAGAVTIKKFHDVAFELSGRSARVKISNLMEKLGDFNIKDIVILSDDVQMIPAWLPDIPHKRIGNTNEMLRNFAKAEISSYLDGSVENYHVNAVWAGSDEEDEEEDFVAAAGEIKKRQALVFAVPTAVYSGLQGILKAYKKRLVGMGSPEMIAWSICGETVANAGAHVVVDWRRDELVGALIKGGLPQRVQRETVGAGDEPLELISSLAMDLVEDPHAINEIVVGGEMAESAEWHNGDTSSTDIHLKKWSVSEELPSIKSPGEIPQRYISLLGAVANFKNSPLTRALCDNSVPLSKSLKENVHALPLVLLGLLLLGIAAGYIHLDGKKESLTAKIETLTEEAALLKEQVDTKASLEKSFKSKRAEVSKMKRNSALLQKTMPATSQNLQKLLAGITTKTPEDIQLVLFEQFSDEMFYIEGKTQDIESIHRMSVGIGELPGVGNVKPEKIEERISNSEESKRPERWYYFRIRLRAKGEQA